MAIYQTSSFATKIEKTCLPPFCSHLKHVGGEKKSFVFRVTFLLRWDIWKEKYWKSSVSTCGNTLFSSQFCGTVFVGCICFQPPFRWQVRWSWSEKYWGQDLQLCIISSASPVQFWVLQWGLAKTSVVASATVVGWTFSNRDYSQG